MNPYSAAVEKLRAISSRDLALALLPTVAPTVVAVLFGPGGPLFVAAFVMLAMLLLAYFWFLRSRPVVLIVGLLIWLSVERFILTAVSARLDATTLTWLLAYKELFFPFLMLVGLPRARQVWAATRGAVRFVDVAAILFGVAILIALTLSGAPLQTRVLYARRFAELPLVYIAARLLPIKLADVRAILVAIVAVAVPVALFGFLERSILETVVWRDLVPAAQYHHLSMAAGITAYTGESHIEQLYQGLPLNFFQFGVGETVRRLVSTYMEPTTLAMYLAFAAAVTLALWPGKWRAYAVAAILALATALTLGKAGVLVLVVAGGYAVVAHLRPELRRPAVVVGIAAGIGVIGVVGAAAMQLFGSWSSVLAHLNGLNDGFNSVVHAPFGHGLGFGGDFGVGQTGAESSIGVMLVQIGLLGVAIWIAWLLGLGVACALAARRSGLELVCLTLAVAIFAFFVTAAFTESAGGLLGNWPYALVPALIFGLAPQGSERGADGDAPKSRIGAWLGAHR
jgi:hypothetical protein